MTSQLVRATAHAITTSHLALPRPQFNQAVHRHRGEVLMLPDP